MSNGRFQQYDDSNVVNINTDSTETVNFCSRKFVNFRGKKNASTIIKTHIDERWGAVKIMGNTQCWNYKHVNGRDAMESKENAFPSLPFSPFLPFPFFLALPSPSSILSLLFRSLPLEVGPLIQLRGVGERCKLPSGFAGLQRSPSRDSLPKSS